jgi:hypothetical protein
MEKQDTEPRLQESIPASVPGQAQERELEWRRRLERLW